MNSAASAFSSVPVRRLRMRSPARKKRSARRSRSRMESFSGARSPFCNRTSSASARIRMVSPLGRDRSCQRVRGLVMVQVRYDEPMEPQIVIGLNAVIVAVTQEVPRILTIRRAGHRLGSAREPGEEARPFGPPDPAGDRTLDLGLRRWVREQTGLEVGYVEQLYTFADRHRDPQERAGGPRVVSVAYLALVREARPSGTAGPQWREWYRCFP